MYDMHNLTTKCRSTTLVQNYIFILLHYIKNFLLTHPAVVSSRLREYRRGSQAPSVGTCLRAPPLSRTAFSSCCSFGCSSMQYERLAAHC